MPLYRLLEGEAFGPELTAAMSAAYEEAIQILQLDRDTPAAEVIAMRIIEAARTGVRDAERLCAVALGGLG